MLSQRKVSRFVSGAHCFWKSQEGWTNSRQQTSRPRQKEREHQPRVMAWTGAGQGQNHLERGSAASLASWGPVLHQSTWAHSCTMKATFPHSTGEKPQQVLYKQNQTKKVRKWGRKKSTTAKCYQGGTCVFSGPLKILLERVLACFSLSLF